MGWSGMSAAIDGRDHLATVYSKSYWVSRAFGDARSDFRRRGGKGYANLRPATAGYRGRSAKISPQGPQQSHSQRSATLFGGETSAVVANRERDHAMPGAGAIHPVCFRPIADIQLPDL